MSEVESGLETGFSAGMRQQLLDRMRNAKQRVEERTQAERRADMTDAEKSRRSKVEKKQLNMRVTSETFDLARDLAEHLDKSIPEMIALALVALAAATPTFKAKGGKA